MQGMANRSVPGLGVFAVACCLWLAACSRSPLLTAVAGSTEEGAATGVTPPEPPAAGMGSTEPEPPVPMPPQAPAPPPSAPPCQPGTGDFIYLVTGDRVIHRFDPLAGRAAEVGELTCARPGESAFSMAVDRSGDAFVLLRPGADIVRASVLDGSCERVEGYVPGQLGYVLFGMAFTAEDNAAGESLFVYGTEDWGSTAGLARLGTDDWLLEPVGAGGEAFSAAELAGTGDGRLFVMFARGAWDRWWLGELDSSRGELLWERELPAFEDDGVVSAFALARWNDNIYAFRATRSLPVATTVTRYEPEGDVFETIARLPFSVVGARATTCAPVN